MVWAAISANRSYFVLAGLFSLGLNLLFLASPLYMLQVYDRVLSSGSKMTLLMLTLALGFTLLTLGLLDDARSKVLSRAGAKLDTDLAGLIFGAQLRAATQGGRGASAQGIRDFDQFRNFIAGNGIHALFDVPWLPIYVAVMFILHPALGAATICAAVLLFALALLNELITRAAIRKINTATTQSNHQMDGIMRNAEVVQAMGMGTAMRRHWQEQRAKTHALGILNGDRSSNIQSSIKFLRILLQSLMLGLGAYLVLQGSITAGAMYAGSLLLGRALAPVEQAVGVWRQWITARAAFASVNKLLEDFPRVEPAMPLPRPTGKIVVDRLVLTAPGNDNPIIRGISFALGAGESLAIVGPSGAGKSTLVRALAGVWKPRSGKVRLDGADVATWDAEDRGQHIGYLPQDIELFGGTVRENIARFGQADPQQIISAAQRASIHEMILRLSHGYETDIGEAGAVLSGGQRQRVGLARALFNDPAVLILDEPNSNLDSDGEAALGTLLVELKRQGRTIVVVSHRPNLLMLVDKIMILRDGNIEAFDTRQEILAKIMPSQTRQATAS
jgi:PrtD family type I secretion system ABC transporter